MISGNYRMLHYRPDEVGERSGPCPPSGFDEHVKRLTLNSAVYPEFPDRRGQGLEVRTGAMSLAWRGF